MREERLDPSTSLDMKKFARHRGHARIVASCEGAVCDEATMVVAKGGRSKRRCEG
jgi:hypothetical protein